MKETIKLGIVLLLFAAVSGGVLAVSNGFTAPIIEEIERQESFGALLDIFPDGEDFVEVDEALLEEITADNKYINEIHEVIENDEIVGYAFQTVSGGYGGDITTITGIDSQGLLVGIKVVNNSETPGLGTRIEDGEFTDSFVEKSTESDLVLVADPSADNEVQLLAGATISSEAVLNGVNQVREAFVSFFAN